MATSPVKSWTRLFGSSSYDQANGIAVTSDGSVFVTGYIQGSLDGQSYSGGTDVFLIKYSSEGARVWTRLLSSLGQERAEAITTSSDGTIYISGYTNNALDGQTFIGNQDAFLAKYTADGSKLWTRQFGSLDSDTATGIATSSDGSIYVSGYTYNTSFDGQIFNGGSVDAFLTKYRPDGTKVWTRFIGGVGNDFGRSVAASSDGSIYITGFSNATSDGSGGCFISKFNSEGTKIWTRSVGMGTSDTPFSIKTGVDGSIYLCGYVILGGGYDAFVSKYNSDGTVLWFNTFGSSAGDIAKGLSIASDGSVYVSGMTGGSFDGQINNGSSDAFITKYSAAGTKMWTQFAGSSSEEESLGIANGSDGSIYISGFTFGFLDGQSNSGNTDIFLVKFQELSSTPSYSLSASSSFVNEGSTTTFTLTTTNVTSGTSVPYTLSGVSASDISGGSLGGNAVVNSIGIATISVTLLNDSLTEGPETLTVTAGGASASTVVNDTSKTPSSTYSISSSSSSVNEGSTVTFTLTTTNVVSGTSVPYTLSGISTTDVSSGLLNGNTIVNSSGIATITIGIASDLLLEGTETLIVTAGGATASTLVLDTSIPDVAPTFNASTGHYYQRISGSIAYQTALTQAATLTYKGLTGYLATITSASENTTIASLYPAGSLWIGASDAAIEGNWKWVSGPENGTQFWQGASSGKVVGSNYVNWYLPYLDNWNGGNILAGSDNGMIYGSALEIAGTWGDSADGESSNGGYVVEFGGMPATYSIAPSLTTVNEGSSVTFTVNTTNIEWGKTVPYSISGISAADISTGSLTGFITVAQSGINGVGFLTLDLVADKLREGNEFLSLAIGDQTSQVTVYDTSVPAISTYSITANSQSVNEGSTATFTLTTTNVASGTSVPYTLSGISAADVSGGSLSGNAVVNSSGLATISVSLLSDLLTEGSETLTVTAAGVTASTLINDTSVAAPEYRLTPTSTFTREGDLTEFILYTKNVPTGTVITYSLSGTGITSADIVGGKLSDTAIVYPASFNGFTGGASIYVYIAQDYLTEGLEELFVYSQGLSASIPIKDSSQSPTYALSAGSSNYNEGSTATFTLVTTNNVGFPPSVPYTLSGISSEDVLGGSLNGVALLNANGIATILITLLSDNLTEGSETLTVSAAEISVSTIINDTSKSSAATYSVAASSASVNEGATADFTVNTTNVTAGSSITYTLSGVSSADIIGGALIGTATVNSNGSATVSIPIASDNLTEGFETLTLTVQGKTASTLINDTSKAAATYSLTASSAFIDEGSVATFSLTTTSVNPGTSIAYTISGVSASDVTGGLSGNATVDTNGLATISVPIAADFLTEGAETLTVTAQGKSASVIINDTSKAALVASYALSASTNSVAEGSNAVFTLTTTNVAAGTSVPYTITGVSSSDITGGATTGNAIVSSSGSATITIPIAADLTTEGTETLTVTAQQVSSSILITDTSIAPVTVTQPNTTVTSIPYGSGQYFVPTAGADRVTGTAYIDVVKQSSTLSSNQIIKLSDGSWQIQNKLIPTNTDTLVNVERIDFTDYSVALDVTGSAGQVAKILGSVFGAAYVKNPTFTGLGLAYLDSGVAYKDLAKLAADAAGLKTPDAIVSTLWKNVIGSTATDANKAPYIKLLNEGMSVGDLVVLASDSSINLQSINFSEISMSGLTFIPSTVPTVTATPTYSLVSNQTTVNEGSSATFTLTTTNVASGTVLTYSLSGVSSSDLTSGSLSGTVTIGSNGAGTISIPIATDNLTEGSESVTVTVQGATASTVISDTSTTLKPTYSLTPAATSVNEGELARVFVNTSNVATGTLLDYSISGISSNDIIGGLTRQVSVDALGQAFINLLTVADQLTEGPETMYITLGNSNTSFIINDTSVTLVGIPIDGGGGGGGAGGGAGGD